MSAKFSKYSTRPSLRIDLTALRRNYQTLKKRVGAVTVGASVKADAYGLGIKPVARSLYGAGCRVFFVATAGEGKLLREAVGDTPSIYVLNGPASKDLRLFFGADLKPVINTLEQAHLWSEAAGPVGSPPFSAVHIDTGMNRLGLSTEALTQLSRHKILFESLRTDLVMSHLACAPDKTHKMNGEQLTRFKRASAQLPLKPLSLANSAGIFLGKPYHFQMVRPGISLYGGKATLDPRQENTVPVVTLQAPVIQIRQIKAGETLGYNASFTAQRDMTVVVVGAGYADGIPVASSSTTKRRVGYGSLQKTRIPIIGRVSMDLTILDVSKLKKPVSTGDMVEFRADQLERDASDNQTLNYELLVRLGQRCRREYIVQD